MPSPNPYITNGTVSKAQVESPFGKLEGSGSYVFTKAQQKFQKAPGGGGTISIVDSRSFPVSKTLAAAIVTLEPGALRELHWHPNAEEWLYFVQGQAQATAFLGGTNARTFDFYAGDTAVCTPLSFNITCPFSSSTLTDKRRCSLITLAIMF